MHNIKVGLQRTTVVNFPRRLAAAVFLPGCNMRCGYCHNAELALANTQGQGLENSVENNYEDIQEVFDHLDKRSNVLSGFVISGGESMLSPALEALILKAKNLGLDVKIDTNGLLPDKLEYILNTPELCPSMIALDIKTSPIRYFELMPSHKQTNNYAEKSILKSINILNNAILHTNLEVEFRTVLVPGLVGKSEIQDIGSLLLSESDWALANFIPGHCLNSDWNSLTPYTPAEAIELECLARNFVKNAKIR